METGQADHLPNGFEQVLAPKLGNAKHVNITMQATTDCKQRALLCVCVNLMTTNPPHSMSG